jgi:accessory gene regulator protein AgrB
MKRIHIMHYFVLAVILSGGLAAFYYARPDTTLQFIVAVILAVAYVAWGLIHHTLQKDLHQKVVVEYILIAAIALVLLATVLRT